jgi:hypothetical protein
MSSSTSSQQQNRADHNLDFHGAALIDSRGREVPITEDMIRHACEDLEQRWHYPAKRPRPAR